MNGMLVQPTDDVVPTSHNTSGVGITNFSQGRYNHSSQVIK